MKRFKILHRFSIFTGFLVVAAGANGQDVHFAQVQDMNIWYNPALKTNKIPLVRANIRSVKYQGIAAYTSKAATIDLPLIGRDKDPKDDISFMNFTAGLDADNSADGNISLSSAMMAFSYALPLNDDNTWLAIGFQGAFTFSRVRYDSYSSFPAQFDINGPIGTAILTDPYQTGNTYSYFTAGAGTAVFHTGEKRQWYIGVSARHINQPLTNKYQSDSYRLPINRGIQAGYTTSITDEDAIGGYANLSWQNGSHEHIIGGQYTRNLGDSAASTLSLGMGYRVGDALIPGLGYKIGSSRFAFSYEFVIAGIARYYSRRSLEFSYTLTL